MHSDGSVINSMLGKYLDVHPKLYKRETHTMTICFFCDHEVLDGSQNHFIHDSYEVKMQCGSESL